MERFLLLGLMCALFFNTQAQNLTYGNEVTLYTGELNVSYNHNVINDIDGDGNVDLLAEAKSGNYLSSVLDISNNPVSAIYQSITGAGMDYYSISLGDLDNDGDLDFLTAGPNGSNTSPNFVGYWDGANSEFTSLGSTYTLFSTYFYGRSSIIGDFNNDGKNDVVWIATDAMYIALNSTENGKYDADITFEAISKISSQRVSVNNNIGVAKGDFNKDGNLDFVVNGRNYDSTTKSYYGSYYLLLGNGDGTFNISYPLTDDGFTGSYVAAGDINNDGYDEFALIRNNNEGSSASQLYLYSWNTENNELDGTLIFSDDSNSGREVIMEDVNNDSYVDIIHRGKSGSNVMIFLNDGSGNFSSSPDMSISVNSRNTSQISVYDMDGNGLKDIVIFNSSKISYIPLVYDKSTDISEVNTSTLNVWPNPTSSLIHINGVQESETYQLYSVTGALVKTGEIANATIDISDLKAGIYLLTINGNNIKVIKQ